MPEQTIQQCVQTADNERATKLAERISLLVTRPLLKQVVSSFRRHQIRDALTEQNGCGSVVQAEILKVFEEIRKDERARFIETIERIRGIDA